MPFRPSRQAVEQHPVDQPHLLQVHDLRTEIRMRSGAVKAVDGVSFHIARGETVGLVGESGCGKTMTGNSIMRLLPPGGHITAGRILFDGSDLVRLDIDELRHVRGGDIGMIFQDPMTSLNPTKTIGHQISEAVRLHRSVSKDDAMARAVEVLDLVGVPQPSERIAAYPHQLSGGLRQRTMIAMAIACEPKLLIADEPTTALDVTIQAQILALLDSLKRELDMAMILITHDMGVIAGRCDRVMVMYAGRIVEVASTDELFGRAHHPYTEALLTSIPRLDQNANQILRSIPGLPPDLMSPPHGCRFAPRCQYVTDRCRDEDPVLGADNPDHAFACFHPRNLEEASAAPTTAAALRARPPGPDKPVEPLLELHELNKRYHVKQASMILRKTRLLHAVTDLSLTVKRGETVGIVGESGCGKSTVARMIVGLERPTSGRIVFDGATVAGPESAKRRAHRELQLMFQDPYASLDPRMRVGDIVAEPLVLQHVGTRQSRERRVTDLLGQVGIASDSLSRYPYEFSGGQLQRISFARALALNPDVIVADEPVSALDVSIRSQVLNLMKDLQGEHNLTYVIISHDLSVIRYLADRVAVMYLGMLMELGTAEDLYSRAAHPYTVGLLDAIPQPDPAAERAKHDAAVMRGELPSPLDPPSGCRFRTRCPRAQERCALETPALTRFGPEHVAACHFPLQPSLRG